MNFPILIAAAVIPMILGMIWYHPAVMGNAWMSVSGVNMEEAKKRNMAIVYLIVFVFFIFVSMILSGIVIHQNAVYSILMGDTSEETKAMLDSFMAKYGQNFRTFKHGAFHGFLTSVFFVLPVIGVSALFENRKWKYIWIHWGFWAISLLLMGGVICQFA